MIPNYIRPQLLIRQLLEVLPQATEPSLNAFVFGPQYDLFRYSNEDERENMSGTAYDEAGNVTLPYEGASNSKLVDQSFTKVHVEKGELSVAYFNADGNGDNKAYYHDRLKPNEIVVQDSTDSYAEVNLADISDGADALADELAGRPVRSGDLALVYTNGGDLIDKRQVMSVRRSVEASTVGDPACSPLNVATTVSGATLSSQNVSADTISVTVTRDEVNKKFAAAGSNFGGELAENFTIIVTDTATANAAGKCKVRTPSNNFEADDVAVTGNNGDFDIVIPDSGVTLTVAFAGNGDELRVGDVFTIDVQAVFTAFDCASDISTAGTYLLSADTNIVATCTTGGDENAAKWTISDTAGLNDTVVATGADLANGVAYGMSGVTVTIDRGADVHRVGDSAEVACAAEGATGKYSVLSLSAPVGDPGQLAGALNEHSLWHACRGRCPIRRQLRCKDKHPHCCNPPADRPMGSAG